MLTFPSHSLNSLIIVSSFFFLRVSAFFSHLNSSEVVVSPICKVWDLQILNRKKNRFEARVSHSIFISRCCWMLHAWLSWMTSRIFYFLLESIPFAYFLFQQSRMTAQVWRQVLDDMRVCKSYDLMMTSHWRNSSNWLFLFPSIDLQDVKIKIV